MVNIKPNIDYLRVVQLKFMKGELEKIPCLPKHIKATDYYEKMQEFLPDAEL